MLKKTLLIVTALCAFCVQLAVAAEFVVELEVPQIDSAEYHRPYVAVWVEDPKRRQVLQITLWLEQEKWHRDLRSWWRRGGKSLVLPIDGVSGATRRPGNYEVRGSVDLAPGSYTLNLEAVREVGGREHLRVPFTWGEESISGELAGQTELGAVTYRIEKES